jgi:molybdopterin-guanine dinucleotide biosynthesis protein A
VRQGKGTLVQGYVLAGGGSKRFGCDKALAEIDGRSMIARMSEVLGGVTSDVHLVVAPGQHLDLHGAKIADRWPGEGPLGGIVTALLASKELGGCEWNLIIGCDMPFLKSEWLADLISRARRSGSDVVVPRSGNGLEPLCACWKTSAAVELQSIFEQGVRKVTEAMKRLRMEIVDETAWKRFDSAGRLFWNMNTQGDYEEAKRILEAERA